MFVHNTRTKLNGTELACNKSTQLHDAFIGHARQLHDLIGCSETRTFGAPVGMYVFRTEFVQFSSCAVNKPLGRPLIVAVEFAREMRIGYSIDGMFEYSTEKTALSIHAESCDRGKMRGSGSKPPNPETTDENKAKIAEDSQQCSCVLVLHCTRLW